MSIVEKRIEQMREKEFDEEIECLRIQFKYTKEALAKDTKFQDGVMLMKDIKNKLNSLHTKDPEKKKVKNGMIIKLCEKIAYCLLKDNKPEKALLVLSELEIIQDIFQEKNLKAIMYIARTHLMLKNYNKAYNYFVRAFGIADDAIKKEIKPFLETIKLKMKEQNDDSDELTVAKFMQLEIGCTSTLLALDSDIQLIPMGSKIVDENSDVTADVMETNKQVESISKQKVFPETIEICTIKASAGILAEFTQKSGNPLPSYELDNTTLESFNVKTFHIKCVCLEHTEFGSASTKQKAKEIAAKKMLKYLQNAGKLRLTTNLGL